MTRQVPVSPAADRLSIELLYVKKNPLETLIQFISGYTVR